MQWLKVSTSNLVHRVGGQLYHKITQMTKVGVGHGMVRSLQIYASPFKIFAMAKIAMDVSSKRYYIEKLQKTEFIYNCYRLTHRKQQKFEL